MDCGINSIEELEEKFMRACEASDMSFIKMLFSNYIYKDFLDNTDVKSQGFVRACKFGNVKVIDYLINFRDVDVDYQNNLGFKTACEEGNLNVVKYLLNPKKLKKTANLSSNIQECLNVAAYKGRLNIIKYLFSLEDGVNKEIINVNEMFKMASIGGHINIIKYLFEGKDIHIPNPNHNNNEALIKACFYGNLRVVVFLFEDDFFKKKYKINDYNGAALINACLSKNKDLVRYLLTSKNLKEKANIHVEKEYAFKFLADNKMMDLLKYYIFDKNIEINSDIECHINQEGNKYVKKMFEMRELNKKLNQSLTKKIKINKSSITKV